MANDPNLQRLLRGLEDQKSSSRRTVESLNAQIKLLERQDADARKLPNADRERAKIREQIKQCRRDIERLTGNVKTLERQIAEQKRMAR